MAVVIREMATRGWVNKGVVTKVVVIRRVVGTSRVGVIRGEKKRGVVNSSCFRN